MIKKQPMNYRRKIKIKMKEPEFFQSRTSPATSYSFVFVFVWLFLLKMHDSFVSFVSCLSFRFPQLFHILMCLVVGAESMLSLFYYILCSY
jgi:uncharacterized membrane protein (DUF106 family)